MNNKPIQQQQFQHWAAWAQILYLTNISILPIVSFVLQLVLYRKVRCSNNTYIITHFRQSILASIVAGILLLIVSGLIIFFGNFESIYTWMWLILYVTCIHSVLILYGVFALVKAQAGNEYHYPFLGRLWK